MRSRLAVFVLLSVLGLAANAFANNALIAAFGNNNQIGRINADTGVVTIIASGSLDTVFSYDKFLVDLPNRLVFQIGLKNGQNTLEKIALSTGTVTFAPLSSSSFMLGGIYGGAIIASINNTIYSIDASTGNAAVIAIGTLDTVYAYDKIIVDSMGGFVYQYGVKNGVNSLQKINLSSGAVTTLPTTLTGDPAFGGFLGQNLIVSVGNQILSLDLTSGSSTVVAAVTLDTVLSGDKFLVDGQNGMAYQYGVKNGVRVIEKVNLVTGTSTTASYGSTDNPNFGAAVPEPSVLSLCVIAALSGFFIHRRS